MTGSFQNTLTREFKEIFENLLSPKYRQSRKKESSVFLLLRKQLRIFDNWSCTRCGNGKSLGFPRVGLGRMIFRFIFCQKTLNVEHQRIKIWQNHDAVMSVDSGWKIEKKSWSILSSLCRFLIYLNIFSFFLYCSVFCFFVLSFIFTRNGRFSFFDQK